MIGGAIGKVRRALQRAMQDEATRLRADYPDFDPGHFETMHLVRPYTMTSPARIHALIEAVRYVTRAGIPGAIVECGVWRGGSMMAVARTLQQLGKTDRELFLFDTFEGMSSPTDRDVDFSGRQAAAVLAEDVAYRAFASLEDVQRSVRSVGYPDARVHYVQGRVEETVPGQAPLQVALLRLDTDWYESTKHELHHLYPRLSSGGVLIIDDYGHWKGSRQATDEFIAATPGFGLLARIDYTGRLAVKP